MKVGMHIPRAMMLRRTAGLVVLILSLSCSSGDDSASRWRVFVDEVTEGKEEAAIAGVLRYDERERCFILDDTASSEERMFAVVWPAGTEGLDGERPGVDVPGVGEIFAGDSLRGGGGYHKIGQGDEPAGLSDCVPPGQEYVGVDTITTGRS
jgi:hypothetical protein